MAKKLKMKTSWGFDTTSIDTSVRPQDDFFAYANGAWMKKTKMPNDESRWGSFSMLRHKTDKELKIILDWILSQKNLSHGSPGQLVRDLYGSALDMKTRNILGASPIRPWQKIITDIDSKKALLLYITKADRFGIAGLWNMYVDQDSKKSDRYILHFYQGGLSMPDRDYYLKDAPEQMRVRNAYILHIRKLLRLAGVTQKEIADRVRIVMNIETLLAKASMSKEDSRDVEKTYNKLSLQTLIKTAPEIDWKPYLKTMGAPTAKEFIVAQPKFLKAVSLLIKTIPLSEWKVYFEWRLISDSASLLSLRFVNEQFAFYGKTITGVKKMKPLWRRALGSVNGGVGEALGKLYVEKHFTEGAKKRMNALVGDLFKAYEKRIQNLDWMSTGTKRKAIQKLREMSRKIGYPSRFKTYKGLNIRATDYFGNAVRINAYEHARQMKKLKGKVDRAEWFMTPQTVNAYCSFSLNEIVFPASILQAPFFDMNADDAVNYAAIGTTIGHEMTHGFDDQGSKFDGKGNMKRWWTKADTKKFEKKASGIASQFDAYVAAPGVNVNGKLTLGENIADLGGISISFDAYQTHLKKTGRKNIDGYTPEERFFLGFAQAEREIARPEFLKTIALIDPHSPAPFRVNGPLSNFEPFYHTFNVKKGDTLYRQEKNRTKVW